MSTACTSHPDVDWMLGELTPSVLARMRREAQASRLGGESCRYGHAWTTTTTRTLPNGKRLCRACALVTQRAYRQRRRKARAA